MQWTNHVRVLCSSRKSGRKTPVLGFPGAVLCLSLAQKRRALGSGLISHLSAQNHRTCVSKKKELEPASSSSRRGARAVYEKYPRDSAFRIAYTVSLVLDTSRSPALCRPPIRQRGSDVFQLLNPYSIVQRIFVNNACALLNKLL